MRESVHLQFRTLASALFFVMAIRLMGRVALGGVRLVLIGRVRGMAVGGMGMMAIGRVPMMSLRLPSGRRSC